MTEFHAQAVSEAREAHGWYAERSLRAALRFRDELDKCVRRISETPSEFAFVRPYYQYVRVSGFPYIVVFRQRSQEEILIVAAAHTSRQSGYWLDRE